MAGGSDDSGASEQLGAAGERYAHTVIADGLRAAAAGALRADDPETMVRLLGALTRSGMLIASSAGPRATRAAAAASLRVLIGGFAAPS